MGGPREGTGMTGNLPVALADTDQIDTVPQASHRNRHGPSPGPN